MDQWETNDRLPHGAAHWGPLNPSRLPAVELRVWTCCCTCCLSSKTYKLFIVKLRTLCPKSKLGRLKVRLSSGSSGLHQYVCFTCADSGVGDDGGVGPLVGAGDGVGALVHPLQTAAVKRHQADAARHLRHR